MSSAAARRRPGPVLEHGPEPVRGLPEPLPAGERILWQGGPAFGALARGVFHVRAVALYFGLLAVWRLVSGLADGAGWAAAALDAAGLLVPAALAIGVLLLLARLYARSTVFTVTDRRVVLRFGVALPMAVNLPFCRIEGAALRLHRDGTGDLPLALGGPGRLAWLHLWPFVRPWRLGRPEPMLRGVPDAAAVAAILRGALERDLARRAEPTGAESSRAGSSGAEPAGPLPGLAVAA